MNPEPTMAALEAALRARGLVLRGAFHPAARADAAPRLPDGRLAGTVVLAGQVGASLWARFSRERRDEPEPLDAWSARALRAIAARFGAAALLPDAGPPFPPFARWARLAEPVHPSPLGLLIHPQHGLWHAYRGALLFPARLVLAASRPQPSPCARCHTRPCLSACPVGAFAAVATGAAVRYDDARCAAHVASAAGSECRLRGCLARRACPVGCTAAYPAEQQRFHMEAFLSKRRSPGARSEPQASEVVGTPASARDRAR